MKNLFTRRGFIRHAAAGSAALTWLSSRRAPLAFGADAAKPAGAKAKKKPAAKKRPVRKAVPKKAAKKQPKLKARKAATKRKKR